MRTARLVGTLTFFLLSLSACGGGKGLSLPDTGGSKQCSKDYNPIPKEIPETDKASKVTWPGSGAPQPAIEAGTYEYVSVEFFYEDQKTNYKFHLAQTLQDNGKYTFQRVCARNTSGLPEFSLDVSFPSKITIANGGKTTSETKVLRFINTDVLKYEISEPTQTQDPPSKVTGEQNFESALYKTLTDKGEVVFEYRFENLNGPVLVGPLWQQGIVRYKKIQ